MYRLRNRIAYLSLLLVLFLPINVSANKIIRSVEGTVVKISDGDTVKVETKEHTILKIRLYGLDSPEVSHGRNPAQPFGKEARNALSDKVFREKVKVDILNIDRYQRAVGVIWLNGRDINLEMIKEGMAEAYKEYLHEPYKTIYILAEKEAHDKKLGIWSLKDYERPSDFRKKVKSKQ